MFAAKSALIFRQCTSLPHTYTAMSGLDNLSTRPSTLYDGEPSHRPDSQPVLTNHGGIEAQNACSPTTKHSTRYPAVRSYNTHHLRTHLHPQLKALCNAAARASSKHGAACSISSCQHGSDSLPSWLAEMCDLCMSKPIS